VRPFYNLLILGADRITTSLDDEFAWIERQRMRPLFVMGPDGDKLLRSSDIARNSDWIFNPNGDTFFASLKAGLCAVRKGCFFVSFYEPIHLGSEFENQLIQMMKHQGGLIWGGNSDWHILGDRHFGWVTPAGYSLLKSLPSDTEMWQLTELRLNKLTQGC
jgi:hypothetical protein